MSSTVLTNSVKSLHREDDRPVVSQETSTKSVKARSCFQPIEQLLNEIDRSTELSACA